MSNGAIIRVVIENGMVKSVAPIGGSVDMKCYYYPSGRPQKMGDVDFYYYDSGRPQKVGGIPFYYWDSGRVQRIGDIKFFYYDSGRLENMEGSDERVLIEFTQ